MIDFMPVVFGSSLIVVLSDVLKSDAMSERKDVIEDLGASSAMPLIQRVENDMMTMSQSQTQSILPQVADVPGHPPQALHAEQLGRLVEALPQELQGPCSAELPQTATPVVPAPPEPHQGHAPSSSPGGPTEMPRPPVRIAMASYEKVTTMCGEKRSLRQVDRALGAMFTNVG